jgi:hypothetical protein
MSMARMKLLTMLATAHTVTQLQVVLVIVLNTGRTTYRANIRYSPRQADNGYVSYRLAFMFY